MNATTITFITKFLDEYPVNQNPNYKHLAEEVAQELNLPVTEVYPVVLNYYKEERIIKAVSDAEFAFWDVIGQHFTEIKTGDFPPLESFQFEDMCLKLVKLWYELNQDTDNETEL